MSKTTLGFAAFVLASLAAASPANALLFDQNVTNNVIFGSGNDNGFFTVDRSNGIEVGLRAKLRFNAAGLPENTFNSNGDGTYTFNAGQAVGGFSSKTPVWNFEWSINSDITGTLVRSLADLEYAISLDFDPGPGTDFLTSDPINLPPTSFADHAIGDNTTGNGDGTEAIDDATYSALIAGNNVAQNSWNMDFFDDTFLYTFDPEAVGVYTFVLAASLDEVPLARTEIRVIVEKAVAVPEPASGLLLLVGLAGFGVLRRRRAAA